MFDFLNSKFKILNQSNKFKALKNAIHLFVENLIIMYFNAHFYQ